MITTGGGYTNTVTTNAGSMPTENEEHMYKGSIAAATVGFIFLAVMEIVVVVKNKNDGEGGWGLLLPLLITSAMLFLLAGVLGFLGYKFVAHGKIMKIVLVVFFSAFVILTIIICTIISQVPSHDFGGVFSDAFFYIVFVLISATGMGVLGCVACTAFPQSNNDVVVVSSSSYAPVPIQQPIYCAPQPMMQPVMMPAPMQTTQQQSTVVIG